MLFGAPYDRRTSAFYVFTCIVILKLQYFVVNKILLYNNKVCDFGTPQGMVNIGEHRESIGIKFIFILNMIVLFEIQLVHFTIMH